MSIEINVLFHGPLPSKAALNRAMKELGFPLTISPPTGSLEKQSGFMPMRFRREDTGVEFDVFDDRGDIGVLMSNLPGDIDPRFHRSANFRWGGDESEMVCGICAAATLARSVNGVVLDSDGETLTADQAVARATQQLRKVTTPAKRWGTRPADIKRYLKELLKQRSDLELVGQHLLIKPVRHILRGVLFDPTRNKYRFQTWRFVRPLWTVDGERSPGYGNCSFGLLWEVWQPHFEPALIDVLSEDVFERAGRITTLAEAAAELSDKDGAPDDDVVFALLLAGERDRAEERVRRVEGLAAGVPFRERSAAALRRHFEQDIDALCAEFRAREALEAKALKIEHIWEPSPFPVELPAAQRTARSAEPLFIPKPWIARPSWLLQEFPEQVGEIRYAKSALDRKGRKVLVAPLNVQQAAERHRNGEPLLAARLPEGLSLLLNRSGEDLRDPSRRPDYVSRGSFSLRLFGAAAMAEASFWQAGDEAGMLELWSVGVYSGDSDWSWRLCGEDATELVTDCREDYSANRNPLTDADIALLRFPQPDFGDFEAAVARIKMVLRSRGYGEIAGNG